MNVEINAGEYAWKPVIVAKVVDAIRSAGHSADVLWADAGCYFHALDPIAERIRASDGLWVRTSSGTMIDWTHPLTFEYLKGDRATYGQKRNADATLVGFATGSQVASVREAVYDDIVVPWKACAMVQDCIAPPGSSRRNHRQDQAVLSYLVHKAGYRFATDTHEEIGGGANAIAGSTITSAFMSRREYASLLSLLSARDVSPTCHISRLRS
jgi:hypothetical protein